MSVLAAIDTALQFSSGADYEGAVEDHAALLAARDAIAKLLNADEEFDAAGLALEEVQNSTSPRTYMTLHHAMARYEYARAVRDSALAEARGAL